MHHLNQLENRESGFFSVRGRLIMAPMAGVTCRIYRSILHAHGADLLTSEMVSAKSIVMKNRNAWRLLANDAHVRPYAIQLFGHDPEVISEAIKHIDSTTYDIIDINMGCPMPKIVNNGEGAALMRDPALAGRIIAAAVRATEKPVTVKIRTGWTPSTINCVEMAKIAQESGASAISVHGRTRDQFYEGRADWQHILAVKDAVQIPVRGNGDIFTPQDALDKLQLVDAVLIARGAMGNPWLFSRTAAALATGEIPPPPTPQEVLAQALAHLHAAAACPFTPIVEMRKHLSWYTKGLHGSAIVRREINQAKTAQEMEAILKENLT